LREQEIRKSRPQESRKNKGRWHIERLEDATTLGQRIRFYRDAQNKTLEDIAIPATITVGQLSRIENDLVTRPHPDTVEEIARELNVTVEQLTLGQTIDWSAQGSLAVHARTVTGPSEANDGPISAKLYPACPEMYWRDLEAATELWTSGLNLRRILEGREGIFENILQREGSVIKAMLLDPAEGHYGAIQEGGVGSDDKAYAKTIVTAHKKICRMRKGRPGKLEIRKVKFPIPFGLDLINASAPDWIVWIRFYPIRRCRLDEIDDPIEEPQYKTYEDQPIVRLDAHEADRTNLCILYKRQFITLWKDLAKDWPCEPSNKSVTQRPR
jgi:transcriptional regulator with XRE-family HTH domain